MSPPVCGSTRRRHRRPSPRWRAWSSPIRFRRRPSPRSPASSPRRGGSWRRPSLPRPRARGGGGDSTGSAGSRFRTRGQTRALNAGSCLRSRLIGARMRAFASDNYAPALPEALEAIAAANTGHVVSYGADPVTARLAERVREHFGAGAVGFPVFNGTGANVVGLRAMLQPWQGVVCAESAHLNVDEGGAPERVSGIKLLAVPAPDGKLTPGLVEPRIERIADEHAIQPGVVSVTKSTELATLYTPEELRALAD